MTDFKIERVANETSIKIYTSANKSSLLSEYVSAAQTNYLSLKQYVSVHLQHFIREELQLYQAYFKEQTDSLLDFTRAKLKKLEDEKDSHQRENIQLKNEVERQKNVIKMMKQEVEDLMILLNSQKQTPKKQISQECQDQPPKPSVHNTVGLEVIEEQQTQRTIMSSEQSDSLIKIQDAQEQENLYSSKSFEIYGQNHPLNQNSHLRSMLSSEEINIQANFPNYSSSKCEPNEQLHQNNEYKIQKNSEKRIQLMDVSERYINYDENRIQKEQKEYEPKTKQFLEEFRKTFNKCLNSAQARKKHSTKTNNKVSSSSMHLTFGKSSHQSYKPRQSSQKVQTMIKNLDSNKFAVGNKKLELRYEGQKKNGQRHGTGTLYFSNGLCYDGQFRNGMRNGNGILKFNHIQIYNGNWQNDEIEGLGKIRNCAIINKKKSISSSYLSRWISYNGEFKGSKFEGEGILFLQGGEKFIGTFMGGTAYGQGSIHKKNGDIENGIWQNNVLMEEL